MGKNRIKWNEKYNDSVYHELVDYLRAQWPKTLIILKKMKMQSILQV